MKAAKRVVNMWSVALVAVGIVGLSAGAARASDLAVDINNGTPGTEPGFVGQSGLSATHSTPLGDITVTLSGGTGFYNRGGSGSPVSLYSDFYYQNNPSGSFTLTLSGAGIDASAAYNMTFYAHDMGDVRSTYVEATAGTSGPRLGPISGTAGSPTTLDQYSASGTYTSDASGNLTFTLSGLGASASCLNGFELEGNIGPPPAAVGGVIVVKTVVLEVTGNVGSVQWESSEDSSTWNEVAGAMGSGLDVTALYTNTPWFRVEATSGTNAPAYSGTMRVGHQAVMHGTLLLFR